MANGEHESGWIAWAPYIASAVGFIFTSLIGVVTWIIRDRNEAHARIQRIETQLERLIEVNERTEDGHKTYRNHLENKAAIRELANEMHRELKHLTDKLERWVSWIGRARRPENGDDE